MSEKKNETLASEIIAGLQAEGKRTALQVEAIEMIIGINKPEYLEKICDYLNEFARSARREEQEQEDKNND